jgi:hypothetical protein
MTPIDKIPGILEEALKAMKCAREGGHTSFLNRRRETTQPVTVIVHQNSLPAAGTICSAAFSLTTYGDLERNRQAYDSG